MGNDMAFAFSEQAREVAAKFLDAVKNEDAAAFWDLLDRQGQGYFLGLWSYVLPNISLTTIISLSGEPGFLKDTLGSIIKNIKENIAPEGIPLPAEVVLEDELHARVNVATGLKKTEAGENHAPAEYIPLVMELVTADKSGRETKEQKAYSFTSWKIDTLRCLRFYSETSLS